MTTIPSTQGVIKTTGPFDIGNTAAEHVLVGPETHVLLVTGDAPGATATLIECEIQYISGGTWLPAMPMPIAPIAGLPSASYTAGYPWGGGKTGFVTGGDNSTDLTNRAFMFPCFGAHAIRFRRLLAGTYTGNYIKHVVGQAPYISALTKEQRSIDWSFFSCTTTASYATGQVIGGERPLPASMAAVDRGAQSRITAISYGDYGAGITDIDIIICNPSSQSSVANAAALDLDYPEAVIAWLEFRASPTGNQYPTRDLGASGGTGGQTGPIALDIPAPSTAGASYAQVFVVARAAMTPSVGTFLYANVSVEV